MTDPTNNSSHHPYKKHRKHNGVRRHKFSMVVSLVSLNNTFEKKTLVLPFAPEVLHLGRQLNANTQPAPDNGYFDSRVLSRTHAEIWADPDTGHVWIRDANSSNGTFVNGKRLDYNYHLKENDIVDFGIDINSENNATYHPKISARVDSISFLSLQHTSGPSLGSSTSNGIANGSSGFSNGSITNKRKDQVMSFDPDQLEAALFGDPNSTLDQLAFVHAQKTDSSIFMNTPMTARATLELVVQSLVTEINTSRVETAKLTSVKQLLADIGSKQESERAIRHKLPSISILASQVKTLAQNLQAAQEQVELKNKEIKRLERTIVALNIDKAEAPSRNSNSKTSNHNNSNSNNKNNNNGNNNNNNNNNNQENGNSSSSNDDIPNSTMAMLASTNNHKVNGSLKLHGHKKCRPSLELAAEEMTVIDNIAYNVSSPPPLNSVTDHSPIVAMHTPNSAVAKGARPCAEEERDRYQQRALLAETKLAVLFPLNLILGMSLGMIAYNKFIK